MAKLGLNVKFRVARSLREKLKTVMLDAFDAKSKSLDSFEIFDLEGANVGAEIVEDSAAPTPEEMKAKGTWLEIVVDDPSATRIALEKHGIAPFEYVDKTHDYVQLPGGQVVRVAPRS